MFKGTILGLLLTVLFALTSAVMTSAHELNVLDKTVVGNGAELQAGTYRVEVSKNQDAAEVRFFHGKVLVATAPATVASEPGKCSATELHTEEIDGRRMITKIRLAGSKESLVFKPATAGS